MTEQPEATTFTFHADWSAADALPALPVNQIAVQNGPAFDGGQGMDGVYLFLGHASPPVLAGPAEGMAERIKQVGDALPVHVYGKFLFSEQRLRELITFLQRAVEQVERAGGG